MAYTEVTISNYNATPPTDDGSTGSANEITWAGIKTKLGDPLNSATDSVNDNVASSCGSIDTAVTTANSTLSTLSSSLSTFQGALNAPAGTALLFAQTAAPTNWTKSATHNNKMLRIVSGTASSGGSTSFTSVFASNRVITTAEMPAHTHTMAKSGTLSFSRSSWMNSVSSSSTNNFSSSGHSGIKSVNSSSASMGTVSISFSGTSGSIGSGDVLDFALQYVDVIIATRN